MFCPLSEDRTRSPQSLTVGGFALNGVCRRFRGSGRGLDQLARAEKCVFVTFQQLHEAGSLHTASSGARAALYVAFPAAQEAPVALPHLPVLSQGHGNEAPAAPTTCTGWRTAPGGLPGVSRRGWKHRSCSNMRCRRWDKEETPNDGLFIDLY